MHYARPYTSVPDHIPVLLDAATSAAPPPPTPAPAFEVLGADAVTVSPYLGRDTDRAVSGLSRQGSLRAGLHLQPVGSRDPGVRPAGEPLFEHVLQEAVTWGDADQIAFVVGATQPEAFRRVRRLLGEAGNWILAPGVGAQGGDLAAAPARPPWPLMEPV